MIFKRINIIKEMPASCSVCILSPEKGQCTLPLTDNGHWTPGHDIKRHEYCPLIELTSDDVDFILNAAQINRNNSASLAEIPGQKWKEAHKTEIKIMDKLINRFNIIQTVIDKQICFSTIREVYITTGETIHDGVSGKFIEYRDFWDAHDKDDGYTMIYLDSENNVVQ